MIPTIINDLKQRDNGITGEYSLHCPTCGTIINIFIELTEEGHFAYTIIKEGHEKCGLLDSDIFYFCASNPFPMQIAKQHWNNINFAESWEDRCAEAAAEEYQRDN